MIDRLRQHRAYLLARHFFHEFFDLGVFGPHGSDAFVRVIIGVIALLVSLGLLLVYLYSRKYAGLFGASTGAPYARALLADTAVAIALPMWVVALVTALVSPSLFPDETDFRVLTPLPLPRRVVFGAKLAALVLFAGVFTLTSHLAMTPLALLIATGPWARDHTVPSVLAYWIVSLAGSVFALLSIVAATGLIITCTPRRYVYGASAAMRSAILAALVLALPLVVALPTQGGRLVRASSALLLAPPAWFLGVQRVLLGHRDAYFVQLAQIAMAACVLAAALATASYLLIYRRFDWYMLRPAADAGRAPRLRAHESAAFAAVRDFTSATLRRSALHQGVLFGLSAGGASLALGILLGNGALAWLRGEQPLGANLLGAIAGMSFPLIAVLGAAAKASLVLPIEPRANWVFRLTEHRGARADQLRVAEHVVTLFAALIPAVVTLPLYWAVAGSRAIAAAALNAAIGLLWAEALLRDWRRIPFTCSYAPGKRSVAQSTLFGVSIFLFVSTLGTALQLAILRGPVPVPIAWLVAVLTVLAVVLRRRRRQQWRETPLAFEDELPADVQLFRLAPWED